MPTRIKNLRTEYLREPFGVTSRTPRLSWQIETDEPDRWVRGATLRVDVSGEVSMQANRLLWRSGPLPVETVFVHLPADLPYVSGMTLYWVLRLDAANGTGVAESEIASFGMGILHETEWRATWISHWDSGITPTGQKRLRFIEHPVADRAAKRAMQEGAPVIAWFRCTFPIEATKVVRRMEARFLAQTADLQGRINGIALLVNEHRIDSEFSTDRFLVASIPAAYCIAGDNLLAVRSVNGLCFAHTANLLGALEITFEDGESRRIETGPGWQSCMLKSDTEAEFPPTADASWVNARLASNMHRLAWSDLRHPHPEIGGEAADMSLCRPKLPASYLRKEFVIQDAVLTARLFISGLGLYHLYLNGRRVGGRAFAPHPTNYGKKILYDSLEVGHLLKAGPNAIGVILGNGRFFAPRLNHLVGSHSYGYPMLLCQLEVSLAGGRRQYVLSDGSWRSTSNGPVRENNEYDGEAYHATDELDGWADSGFDDAGWAGIFEVLPPSVRIVSSGVEENNVVEQGEPVEIVECGGRYIVDFGRPIYGNVSITAPGRVGDCASWVSGYSLNQAGGLLRENNRSALSRDTYYFKGGGTESWQPLFRGQGFRRVEIERWPGMPQRDQIRANVIRNAVDRIGFFSCSDPLVNRIYENITNVQQMYFRGLPMDPDRDERMGWMGDIARNAGSFLWNWDAPAFFHKWMDDIALEQEADGHVPDVVPAYWDVFTDSITWPASFIFIPWLLHRRYGDTRFLSDHFDGRKRWIDFVTSRLREDFTTDACVYNDWCDTATLEQGNYHFGKTDGALISTAYIAQYFRVMAQMAQVLGKAGDAERYLQMLEKVNAGFIRRFTCDGRKPLCQTQCAHALAICFDLIPPEAKPEFHRSFAASIEKAAGHPTAGLIGMQWLFRAMSIIGRDDIAFAMLRKIECPSWGYMIAKGSRGIWEKWNTDKEGPGMNSEALIFLGGGIIDWLFRNLAGIRPNAVAGRSFILQPSVDLPIAAAAATHRCPHGIIASDWKKEADHLRWEVRVPFGSEATVELPPGWEFWGAGDAQEGTSFSRTLPAGCHLLHARGPVPGTGWPRGGEI